MIFALLFPCPRCCGFREFNGEENCRFLALTRCEFSLFERRIFLLKLKLFPKPLSAVVIWGIYGIWKSQDLFSC